MVIMASGIALGRVSATTTTEVPNMAPILQKRDIQSWFTVYVFDIGHTYYDQLTPVKTRCLLTRITRLYRGVKFIAHRSHMFL